MSTRNIVPREKGEGSLGTKEKPWGAVYTHGVCTWKPNEEVSVGEIRYHINLPSWARLECVQSGTTEATEPTEFATVQSGGGIRT